MCVLCVLCVCEKKKLVIRQEKREGNTARARSYDANHLFWTHHGLFVYGVRKTIGGRIGGGGDSVS